MRSCKRVPFPLSVNRRTILRSSVGSVALLALLIPLRAAHAVPVGYTSVTVPTNAPPSGLAYAPPGSPLPGVLYAFEAPPLGTNNSVIRTILPDLTFGSDIPVSSLDPSSFFVGSMTYDHVTDELLLTDNSFGANALYSINPTTAVRTVLAPGISSIAGVAVRSTGEIFVSTAPFADNAGQVLQVDRGTGTTTPVLSGLDFGAGLAFDAAGDLIIQDADFATFEGTLRRLPIDDSGPGLVFGAPSFLISGLQAGAGLAIDSEGDFFVTGSGGLFEVAGIPLTAVSFDSNGNPFQFSTAISFFPGAGPFEPFASGGGRLAFLSDFGFAQQDNFVTIITTDAPLAIIPEPATMTVIWPFLLALAYRERTLVQRRRRGARAQSPGVERAG